MGMFVQGFWFGSKLVREDKVSAGGVMAVFWVCLIAASNMQMCIPQFIILAKGKFSMVSLISLATSTPQSRNLRVLKKITPPRYSGELALHNVTFAYPSRPTIPVLSNVSIFLPANEITFIVGSSGSRKSAVAQLLLRIYSPQVGHHRRPRRLVP
jgi:ATP-binding cassette subfamily B (MDR/TAP) protein 1